MYKLICDKCKKEVVINDNYSLLKHYDINSKEIKLDLCLECTNKFIKWFNNE
jgi:hypothetical protein